MKAAENHSMQSFVDKVVLPGDLLGKLEGNKMRMGIGLIQNENHILATKVGALREQQNHFWIENIQKRVCEQNESIVYLNKIVKFTIIVRSSC